MINMRSGDVMVNVGVVVVLLVLCSTVTSAPVEPRYGAKDVKDVGKSQDNIENQEKELESLIRLAQDQASDKNVQVQKIHRLKVEEQNGERVEDHVMEEKVVNQEDGTVVADVKQEVKEVKSGDAVQPEAVVKTEVSIPAAGIDEEFVEKKNDDEPETDDENIGSDDDDDDDNTTSDDVEEEEEIPTPSIPFTTQDMAEYLYLTQQFDQFLPALERLVDMKKMTATDAASYAKDVIEDYERLGVQQALADTLAYNKRMPQSFYPMQAQPMSQPLARQYISPPTDLYGYPAYLTPQEQLYLEQQQQQQQQLQQQQQQLLQEQYIPREQQNPEYSIDSYVPQSLDPLDFLTVLYNAAYGKGNPEAQEVVQLLYDKVSHDGNPDDLAQIRDLLVDTLSSSVYGNNYPGQLINGLPVEDSLLMSPGLAEENQLASLENAVENEEMNDDDDDEDEDDDETIGEEVKRSDETVNISNSDVEKEASKDDESNELEDELVNVSEEKNES